MRRGWFSVWSAFAIFLALSVAPLHAQFVYVANDIIGPGGVSGYTINLATGAFTAIAGSPFAAGVEPTSVAVDLKGKFAYVANNGDPNESVSAYSIGPNGVLTPVPGSPFAGQFGSRAVAVDPSSKFVYVANSVVGDTQPGSVSGYTIDPRTGALTIIAGSPFAAGVGADSVAVDPSGKFAYVVNAGYDAVEGYTINPTTGALVAIPGIFPFGPGFPAGAGPTSVAIDPSGKFAYVANGKDNNISGYTINSTTGVLTPVAGSPFAAGANPQSVTVDPSGKFAYASKPFGNSISGYAIDPTTGALTAIADSPFNAGPRPISLAFSRSKPSVRGVCITNEGSKSVSAINPSSNTVVDTVRVGPDPVVSWREAR